MAEFFKNYLINGWSPMTFPRWVRSLKTTSKASFLDAEVNNDPAYLPGALSAMAGGLWPEINYTVTWNWLCRFWGEEKSWNESKFLEHHWLFIIKYISIMNNYAKLQFQKDYLNFYLIKLQKYALSCLIQNINVFYLIQTERFKNNFRKAMIRWGFFRRGFWHFLC